MIITAKAIVATVVAGAGFLAFPAGGDASTTTPQVNHPSPGVGLPGLFAPMQN